MSCLVDSDLVNTLVELTRYEEQAKCKFMDDLKKLSGKSQCQKGSNTIQFLKNVNLEYYNPIDKVTISKELIDWSEISTEDEDSCNATARKRISTIKGNINKLLRLIQN